MLRRTFARFFVGNMSCRPTPNPDCLQFRPLPPLDGVLPPDCPPCEIPYRSLAAVHPLSQLLFDQYEKEIRSVFLAEEYVAITKWTDIRWNIELERSISSLIGSFLMTHDTVRPLRNAALGLDAADNSLLVDEAKDSEVMQCVKELLRKEVRPMVQRDGGDIQLMEFDEPQGIVRLKMLGACRSCPSSQNTLKEGIERMLQHYVPEVKEVVEYKTQQDTLMDEMSRQRMEAAAAEAAAEKQKQQQQKENGGEQNASEGDVNDKTNKTRAAEEKEQRIAVSFGTKTITATAGWNRAEMQKQYQQQQQDQEQEEQRERERQNIALKKQLEMVGAATDVTAVPVPMTQDERDEMRSRGFLTHRPSQTRPDAAQTLNPEQRTAAVMQNMFGFSAADAAASQEREATIERELAAEQQRQQEKWAKIRAQRQRKVREVGLDEPEG